MMLENSEMKTDNSVTINWFRVNVPTIIAIFGMVWYQATTITALKEQLTNAKTQFDLMATKIDPMTNAIYRVATIEGQMSESSKKNDKLSDAVGQLTTSVELLSQKLDMLAPVRPVK